MAYTTIDDPSEFFNTILYTGDGNASGARSITGVGFKPDWVWIKERDNTAYHNLFDSNRGVGKVLHTNTNDAEGDYTSYHTAFGSDGFTLENNPGSLNGNTDTYVAWNWKANGGTTSSNTDGSITSTVQANTTAGFSIVTYTGTGSNATVGHGLGAKPNVILLKDRAGFSWVVYHDKVASDPATDYLEFNGTIAATDYAAHFNDTEPTSTVFSLGTDGAVNGSSRNVIAYCFAEKKGYSKFGSFIGNNSSDGAFVYLGFKPRWIMVKNTTQTHDNHDWIIFDSARETNNEIDTFLRANDVTAEVTSGRNEVDFLSNGFKARASYGDFNGGSNHEFAYYAFAEHPFVSSKGVPTTAF